MRIVWPPTGRRHCHDSVGPGSACTTRRVPVSARSWLGPLAAAQPDNGPARPGPSAVTRARAGPRRALPVRSPGSTRFLGGGHASLLRTDSRARHRHRRARPPLGDRLAGVRCSRPWTRPPPSPGRSASDESAGLLRQGQRESLLGGHTWWRAPLRPERPPPARRRGRGSPHDAQRCPPPALSGGGGRSKARMALNVYASCTPNALSLAHAWCCRAAPSPPLAGAGEVQWGTQG